MTEQWQELKETITEMRDNDGTGTQQDACKFLVDYMETLEKQMQEPCEDKGEISDGYHTFNQLYHQRAILFATIVNQNKDKAWKSFKHSDGKYCFDSDGEWFIVGVDTPQGSYTYHYAKEYWDMFDCQELECGKEWDGHTEEDVTRLLSLEQQPCEDCISRQAVIILIDEASEMHPYKVIGYYDTYSNYNQGWSDACDWLYANIVGVPSVKPKYTDEEIDKAQAVEQAYVDKMVELAVEEAKRPKGKWIRIARFEDCNYDKCSVCGVYQLFYYGKPSTNYCPNCGAKMEKMEMKDET